MLLPDSMELRISVPYNSRSTAWASFDGRGRVEIRQGDHIKVTASQYPFPTVCADKQSTDWFQAITRTLKWNERQRQKSFVVVEQSREDADADANNSNNGARDRDHAGRTFSARSHAGSHSQNNTTHVPCTSHSAQPGGPSQPAYEEDDDDETFDIDDIPLEPISTQTTASSSSSLAPSPSTGSRPSGASPETQEQQHDRAVGASNTQDAQADLAREVDSLHLRQYATHRPRPAPSSSSSQRTPRPGETTSHRSPPQNDPHAISASAPIPSTAHRPRPSNRDFSHGGRSRVHYPHTSNPSVKAFVVFGADSSDAETSASE